MSSDLISREEVFNILRHLDVNFANSFDWHTLKEVRKLVEEIPSASIPEHAMAIKKYCEGFPECEGCRFDNGAFHCKLHACPSGWDLPESEKE